MSDDSESDYAAPSSRSSRDKKRPKSANPSDRKPAVKSKGKSNSNPKSKSKRKRADNGSDSDSASSYSQSPSSFSSPSEFSEEDNESDYSDRPKKAKAKAAKATPASNKKSLSKPSSNKKPPSKVPRKPAPKDPDDSDLSAVSPNENTPFSSQNTHFKAENVSDGEIPSPSDKRKSAPQSFQKSAKKREMLSVLPLYAPKAAIPNSLILQIEDPQLNMNDDSGVIGRLKIENNKTDNNNAHDGKQLILDVKGNLYSAQLFPSCTIALVTCGPTEAKIEGLSDCITVTSPLDDLYGSSTGTGYLDLADDLDEDVNAEWAAEEKEKKKEKAKQKKEKEKENEKADKKFKSFGSRSKNKAKKPKKKAPSKKASTSNKKSKQ